MQKTLFVENTALFLADTSAADVLSDNGKKVHKPILSKARTGTYTPYQDITFKQQSASKQTLEVDTYLYGAEEIDNTDKKQTGNYDPVSFSSMSMQRNLNNEVEQKFLSKITGAKHVIDGATLGGASGSFLDFSGDAIFDAFEVADSKLGSVDAPFDNRVAVLGPHDVSAIRKLKSQRETRLGDTILENGVISMWNGWMIVQNNNLPYSATLGLATNPTDGDTITIAGVTYTFVDTLTPLAGEIHIASTVDITRANLAEAINDPYTTETEATDTGYVKLGIEDAFIIAEKRRITATNNNSANTLAIAGYGDIVVASDLTDGTDAWTGQRQDALFGVRGMIDLVVQIDPNDIETTRKEKGFATLVKSLLGMGAKMFDDGARVSINTKIDASGWK